MGSGIAVEIASRDKTKTATVSASQAGTSPTLCYAPRAGFGPNPSSSPSLFVSLECIELVEQDGTSGTEERHTSRRA
jgi:hypothetical protein